MCIHGLTDLYSPQAGVVSFGVKCAGEKPNVYARVPQQDIMKWIKDVVNSRTTDDNKAIYNSKCERLDTIEK